MTRFRLLMIVIAVVLVCIAGAGGVWLKTGRMPWEAWFGASLKAISLEAARRDVDATLKGAPEYAPYLLALNAAFPNDYSRLLGKFASRRALAGGQESADLYITDAISSLNQTRGTLAARASGPALEAIFAAKARITGALAATDARLCVDFIYGNSSPGYFDFAAKHRELIAEMAQAELAAIVDGQRARLERGAPSEADLLLFEKALNKAGMSRADIEAFVDGKTPEPPLPDAKHCEAGRLYYVVLKTLDELVRLRIYGRAVELMAKS